ncbi:Uncharacterized protein APZ42_021912 [Daphnia magna]|uniref:Uncharacterized protein n=1 Tax=Daphnia magna TaxID=35525 RepID=A0A164W8I8_9CRUS|nr:Uncharacterized protein APZ42_021912 [Daphnia magna]
MNYSLKKKTTPPLFYSALFSCLMSRSSFESSKIKHANSITRRCSSLLEMEKKMVLCEGAFISLSALSLIGDSVALSFMLSSSFCFVQSHDRNEHLKNEDEEEEKKWIDVILYIL